METVFTPLPIFNKPGYLRDMVDERSLAFRWVFAENPPKGKASAEEATRAIMAHAATMEYLVIGTSPLDRAFFEAAVNLKLVAMFGVGLDHIDLDAAADHGVLVTNVPGGNARSVAELAVAMMFDLARKITWMHTELGEGIWRERLGSELLGKTLGIVGLGHIGRETALLGKALGMRVIAANRTPRPEIAAELGIAQVGLDEVLREADFLSLHIPGGAGSWRFGADEFAKMKPSAVVINTARGDLVDIDALADALAERRLAGAGLDVFPVEPMDLAHPIFSLPQVVATPHAGATSREATGRVTASCLDEVVRIREGKRSPNARNSGVYTMPGWERFAT